VKATEFAIGSASTCQLKLRGPAFPDRICKLQVGTDELWIERESDDAILKRNSADVTARTKLADGDTIEIGPMAFLIRLDGVEPAKPKQQRHISDDEICQWLGEEGGAEYSESTTIPLK